MKFFFQCVLFYLGSAVILIVLDQFILNPNRVLSASVLFGLVLGLILSIIFGWYLEAHVNHSHDFSKRRK